MQTVEQRYQAGKDLRKQVPRSTHARVARADGVDPVSLLLGQDTGRIQTLVPVRHARMTEDAFAFYRAGALLMATDLAGTPTTSLMVQASGDAHLSNFGFYGSPVRSLVFDANDFDETLSASFEWDLKRLATSFWIAAEDNGFDAADREETTMHCVREYRDAMAQFASLGLLDVWYAHFSAERLVEKLREEGRDKRADRLERKVEKAHTKDSRHALGKLAEKVDGAYRIREDHPWLVPVRSMGDLYSPDRLRALLESQFEAYLDTLPDNIAHLARSYRYVDAALKVVGVGSVGTRCFVVLLQGRDEDDPLFLQIKEAGPSVLSERFGTSPYGHEGQRVVEGQRLMQTTSDIFLGWMTGPTGRPFHVRQLKDMKTSIDVEDMDPKGLRRYATACAWTLAQSHARSGDAVMLAGYMGSGDVFAEAIAQFAESYADQNREDYEAFRAATAARASPASNR